jgi:hypothetical protein
MNFIHCQENGKICSKVLSLSSYKLILHTIDKIDELKQKGFYLSKTCITFAQ